MQITVNVREVGRRTSEYSIEIEVPAPPSVGDYISVFRPDAQYHSEDLIVRHLWWRYDYPDTSGYGSTPPAIGKFTELMVECDQAIGPNSLDRWRDGLEGAKARGHDVTEFAIDRLSIRQADMGEAGGKR